MQPIRNSNEADQTLLKIGRLQRDIQSEKILLDDGIEQLKKMSLRKVAPLCDEREAAEEVLLEYIKTNKSEIASGSAKSVTLTHGTIGLRDDPSALALMRGFKEEDVAKSLVKAGYKQYVDIKYKLIRSAIKSLDDAAGKLAKFGIKITQKRNVPFYTIDEAKIGEKE
jgi:phage host-nuclease inhibitor protein Gam